MVGNDRSGTVDANLNLLKAVELALTGGYDLIPFTDPMTGKTEHRRPLGAGHRRRRRSFATWEQFWEAYAAQTRHIIRRIVELYERSRGDPRPLRADALPLVPGAGLRARRAWTSPRAARSSATSPSRRSPTPPRSIRCWRSSTWSSTRRSAPWPS